MEYRQLGRSGLRVSPLCLGTMNFGGPTDAATAGRIIARAREAGVNFIDTADVYTGGASEEITGAAIRGDRDGWVVATKVGNATGTGPNGAGLSRKWVMAAAEAEPAAAGHGLRGHLLPAQGGPCDAAGGDGACDGGFDPGGEGPVFRAVELPGVAGGGGVPAVR